jgi:hypothetical protein
MNTPENGQCAVCGGPYAHFGNNPEPLLPAGKRVCDDCNGEYVIPARLGAPLTVRTHDGALVDFRPAPREGRPPTPDLTTYTVLSAAGARTYRGFQNYTGASRFLAVADFDGVELWDVDPLNPGRGAAELKRYYREQYDRDVRVRVFEEGRPPAAD